MRIEIDEYSYRALHRLYMHAYNNIHCDDCGEGCEFHISENPETVPMSREPKEFCALGIVRELIMEIERENN